MYKIYPKTLFIGQKLLYLPACQSTNDEAATLLQTADPAEGTVVVTDNQQAGRGQRGNSWQATAGQNLTFSLILKPDFLPATDQFWLNMAISLGILEVLNSLLAGVSAPIRVKWPNDLYVGQRKIGGVLIENYVQGRHIGSSIVGIGLNVNQVVFDYPSATSLQQEAPLPDGYTLQGLLAQLCERIEPFYLQLRAHQRHRLRQTYLAHLFRIGEPHLYVADNRTFKGIITDVDSHGRLGVAENNRVQYYGFQEIRFLL